MTKNATKVILLALCMFLSGCSILQPGYETPIVSISSFDAIPSQGMIPRFQIGLKIINPNRTALKLQGISYNISLEGHHIITGVSNSLPEVAPYGEEDVILNASVDLFSSIGFVSDLIRSRDKENISYDLETKLDTGTLLPPIKVSKKGKLSLIQNFKP